MLVADFGGKCHDCGVAYPPYVFEFDHRDPSTKSFGVGCGNTWAYEKMKAEAEKCDLVCSNCHKHRTHLQRCSGCEYCVC